jgi:hypothetical protein
MRETKDWVETESQPGKTKSLQWSDEDVCPSQRHQRRRHKKEQAEDSATRDSQRLRLESSLP